MEDLQDNSFYIQVSHLLFTAFYDHLPSSVNKNKGQNRFHYSKTNSKDLYRVKLPGPR